MNRRDFLNSLSDNHEGNFRGAIPILLIFVALVSVIYGGLWYWGNSIKLQEYEVKVEKLEREARGHKVQLVNCFYTGCYIGEKCKMLILDEESLDFLQNRTRSVITVFDCETIANDLLRDWQWIDPDTLKYRDIGGG